MIYFDDPAPETIDGPRIEAEIAAAGYTEPHVALHPSEIEGVPYRVAVLVDEEEEDVAVAEIVGLIRAHRNLAVDKVAIVADGDDTATVRYRTDELTPVAFTINGSVEQVEPDQGVAAVEIVSSLPGPIFVAAGGLSITITAEGV